MTRSASGEYCTRAECCIYLAGGRVMVESNYQYQEVPARITGTLVPLSLISIRPYTTHTLFIPIHKAIAAAMVAELRDAMPPLPQIADSKAQFSEGNECRILVCPSVRRHAILLYIANMPRGSRRVSRRMMPQTTSRREFCAFSQMLTS